MSSWKLLSLSLLGYFSSAVCAKTCIVPTTNGTKSDAAAIQKVFAQCAEDSTILFQKGYDYNVFEPITATNLSNVVISVQGNLNLPQNISYVQEIVKAGGGSVYWFDLKGTNVKYIGSEDVTTGWIRSYGQQWWDANPAGSTGLANRPHLMRFQVTNGVIKYLKSWKPIGWNISVKGSNIAISHSIVDAVSESGSFPFNTDGFGIAATDVTVTDCVIYNGDDAIAITDGAHNVLVQRSTVGYQTHGLSIGSLGSDYKKFVNVSDIKFNDITFAGGLYASRLKSWTGGQGLVKNVEWSNIRLFNVTFPIFITQTYWDQGKATSDRPTNQSVAMENFTWQNWRGSINSYQPGDGSCASDPCWYDVGLPNLKHNEAIILECYDEESCQNFKFDDIRIYPQDVSAPTVICMNAQADLNPNMGIECRNGTFVPLY
ncbi:polygalacturonase [Thelonectria olida]|uniref:galacturonan 1,4-alpha-galacturonidase n=1 Tax=Thelonectria olida TaxID=1576542 RepID=A0A9P8WBR7_9HYPO|nr:polygalacturonase [Thelonectria olida]